MCVRHILIKQQKNLSLRFERKKDHLRFIRITIFTQTFLLIYLRPGNKPNLSSPPPSVCVDLSFPRTMENPLSRRLTQSHFSEVYVRFVFQFTILIKFETIVFYFINLGLFSINFPYLKDCTNTKLQQSN